MDDEPSFDTAEGIADVVAQSANSDEEIDLINTGQIKLIQNDDLETANLIEESNDVADDDPEEYEILDDVIPLDDDGHLLVETNEVEVIDEPIIDEDNVDFDEDDDGKIVVFED